MATRDFSSIQEKIVASYLDGKLTPNSGAGHTKKGDILIDDFGIVECKTKISKSTTHSIKSSWIDTIKKECIAMGRKYWGIVFDFGTQDLRDQMVIIPLTDYLEFIDYKREEQEYVK